MDTQRDHDQCTFCDLIRGAAEVSICHEDADAIAFMDIQPVNNGHVLVVPRVHYESMLDVPPALGIHLFQVTMRLANAVRQVTGCDDFNIVVNSGAAAGQDEPHYHVHIIPRRDGDGFDIPLPFNGSEMPDRTLLDAYAARIGSALSDPVKGSSGSGHDGHHLDGAAHESTSTASTTASSNASASRKHERHADATGRHAPVLERAVALPTYHESNSMKAPGTSEAEPGLMHHGAEPHEGAHGELTYDAVDAA
jgi:histidine triad (HIT) family protein